MTRPTGRFITLEGSEGVGKSTNVAFIRDYLHACGVSVITTREPGGTARAEAIRALLLATDETEPLDNLAELLLVFAARAQHLARVIRPALARGDWVVCDRFTDATFAYQGVARGGDIEHIARLEQLVQQSLTPDLTVLLDMPVAAARERLRVRGGDPDRFEREQASFFEQVRQGYQQRAEQHPQRFVTVDAAAPLEQVQQHLQQILDQRIAQWQ